MPKMQVGSRMNEAFTSLDELDFSAEDEHNSHDQDAEESRDEVRQLSRHHSGVTIRHRNIVASESDAIELGGPDDSGGTSNTSRTSVSFSTSRVSPGTTNSPPTDNDDSMETMTATTVATSTVTRATNGTRSSSRRRASLTELIENQKGQHILERIQRHPSSLRRKNDITLNGIRTRAYPLHHMVSLKPPVSKTHVHVNLVPETLLSSPSDRLLCDV